MKYIIADKIAKKYNIPKEELESIIFTMPNNYINTIFNDLEKEYLVKIDKEQRVKCFNLLDEHENQIDKLTSEELKKLIIEKCTNKFGQRFTFCCRKIDIIFIYRTFLHNTTDKEMYLMDKCLGRVLEKQVEELGKLKLDISYNDKEIMKKFMKELRNEFDKNGLDFVGITYEFK